MAKYGRLIIDFGYVVDMSDEDMIEECKSAFTDDILNTEKQEYGGLLGKIKIIEDDKATTINMPEHVKEILKITE